MIKLSKKSLLLIISALAMAAFAMPSLASATIFDGAGTHGLTSSNLSFTSAGLGGGSICTSSTFTVNVATGGATATVTGARFTGCTGTDLVVGTPTDVTATGFPWFITRTAAGAFTVDGVRVLVNFTGAFPVDLSGNLTNGTINCGTHVVTYTGANGLTATTTPPAAMATAPATVSGTLTDDQQTLCVT